MTMNLTTPENQTHSSHIIPKVRPFGGGDRPPWVIKTHDKISSSFHRRSDWEHYKHLTHSIIHDIRNPMTYLYGKAQLVEIELQSLPGETLPSLQNFGFDVTQALIRRDFANLTIDKHGIPIFSGNLSLLGDPGADLKNLVNYAYMSGIPQTEYTAKKLAEPSARKNLQTAILSKRAECFATRPELYPFMRNFIINRDKMSVRDVRSYFEALLTYFSDDIHTLGIAINKLEESQALLNLNGRADSLTKVLSSTRSSIVNAQDAVDQSLYLFNPERFNIETERNMFNVNDLIQHKVNQVSFPKKTNVTVELEPNLEVLAHPLIKRVILNLLSNANKYTRDQIYITLTESGSVITLYVVDNGHGVPAGYEETIFELGKQTPSSKAGTGVGLALSKDIVERHGGKLGVDTVEGAGAAFYVVLPKAYDYTATADECSAAQDHARQLRERLVLKPQPVPQTQLA